MNPKPQNIGIFVVAGWICCCSLVRCSGQIDKSNTITTLQDSILSVFGNPLAPEDVYPDLIKLIGDSTKEDIRRTISISRYFEIDIEIQDSTISKATVRYRPHDMSQTLCDKIAIDLIGLQPKYSFINRFQYASYSYVVDKEKIVH